MDHAFSVKVNTIKRLAGVHRVAVNVLYACANDLEVFGSFSFTSVGTGIADASVASSP